MKKYSRGSTGYIDVGVQMITTIVLGILIMAGFMGITNNSVIPGISKAYAKEPETTVSAATFHQRTDPVPTIDLGNQNTGSDIKLMFFQNIGGNTVINDNDKTIVITVGSGADVTNMIPVFSLSDGAKAEINGVTQVSGISVVNFSTRQTYLITSESGQKTAWLVTVKK